ncbi:MAG: hypothetical protein LBL08_01715 [Candidatus Nomurabacteria bacterium]|jgi:hypothetical protein|nr:hypothetical protein [Candidatus Nomurabacteria bacterium]
MAKINNKHHQRTRGIAVAALIAGVVGLGVAFAALSTTLNITGTAKVGEADWDIHWDNLSCSVTAGEAKVGTPLPAISGGITITLAPEFTAPGDQVTCNFDAVNDGDLDAKMTQASFVNNTTNLASIGSTGGIGYTFKYRSASGGATSGAAVGAADINLASGDTHEMQLILTNNNTGLESSNDQDSFSFNLPYVQKNQ